MLENKKIVFIVNPISGVGKKDMLPEVVDKYISRETNEIEIISTEYAGHAFDIAKQKAQEGVDIVVAVGGDGTVNEVARGLVESKTALGIIPCGSGNGLARHLMLPINMEGAMKIIAEGVVHALDYGIINDHPFFCTCGMGFDAFISKKFADAGKRGPMTYIENVLVEGLKYKPETYSITLDGNETEPHKAFLVSVANASQYGNDAYIAPKASMSDGLLDVVIMEPFDIIDAPQVGLDLINKTLDKSSKIRSFKAKDIHITRSAPGVIHFDGDPIMEGTDLHVQLKSKGIRIIINDHADKSRRKPNVMQSAFSEFFNELITVRDDLTHPVSTMKSILKKV
ncbi:MAG: diacylglycerol kinase family lipid kinase [Prevotella sp.]|nr:diacylglycerol kinase family lipid kinase [Prevotella sp.]MBR4521619.1 diacylglycerol kinase family lipid kinase [Prevotella sp.]